MKDKTVPEGWGEDALSAFIEMANRNSLRAFVHYKDWFTLLQDIDSIFNKFSKNMLNVSVFYEPFLFVRAHSTYRAAIRLATSGQMPEAFSLLRGCIEYSLYGFYFNKFPSVIQTWIGRDESDAGKKRARNTLKFSTMLTELRESHDATGSAARQLYERTIDAGAHPNPKTITLSLKREETDELVSFELAQLNNNPEILIFGFKTCAQVGICSLKIFKLVFPERFALLGLSDLVEEVSGKKIGGIPL